ncbi:MAG: Fe-S cluster assembly ATPase SufC [Acidimicrobiales bacterium]
MRLVIDDLRGGIPGQEIVQGISITVPAGEVHAIMGPNGSGKSTLAALMLGRPGYSVTSGSVRLEGDGGEGDALELLGLPTWQRAQAGVFLAMQKPLEVPGVSLVDALGAAFEAGGRDPALVGARLAQEADRVGFERRFLDRPLNVDLSGGERKRNETVQLGVLQPSFAVLDEIDSGLDIDALRAVARRIEAETTERGLGVLVITHFSRLLTELRADRIHVLSRGRIVDSGGPELAEQLEADGYVRYEPDAQVDLPAPGLAPPVSAPADDPFADPLA